MSRILLIDFDGVLHSYTSPWTDEGTISDPPVEGAIEWLRSILKEFEVNIYSSRSKKQAGILAMQAWLKKYGLSNDELNKIGFPIQKLGAFLTIDDRAICFTGKFPTIHEMNSFKPWNK